MNIGTYTFEEFKEMARRFHGFPAPGLLIGGYMVELVKRELPPDILYDAMVETGKCLPDAVQLLTPCSYGNGWMRIVNLGRYALTLYNKYTGEGLRVGLNMHRMEDWPEIRDWFLKAKPKAEQDSEELFRQIEAAGDGYMNLQRVQIAAKHFNRKHMGQVGLCPVCREAYPVNDGAICRACQGDAPYASAARACQEETHPSWLHAVPVDESVGHRALHDMTQIIPGESKGPAFQAGEEIGAGDLCRLQQMGRSSVYVESERLAGDEEWVHENVAAADFARRMAGDNVALSESPKEGKVTFYASCNGLLQIDSSKLEQFNLVPDVMCASRQNSILVERDKPFAGCRAIPLYISRDNYSRALAALGNEPLFEVLPLRPLKVGILVTGTEVFQGFIEDKFQPVIKGKVERFGCQVAASEIVPDDRNQIAAAVHALQQAGAELIVTTAGLSVDPDDVTRKGLLDAGLEDMLYGAPILPGAMTLLGRIGSVRVIGVPACALFFKTTSFDLLLPRLLAGKEVTRGDLARLAEGGFCLGCKSCTFPKCPFGK